MRDYKNRILKCDEYSSRKTHPAVFANHLMHMINRQFSRKVLRYYRTYGLQATIRRIVAETLNWVRRSFSQAQASYYPKFDRRLLIAKIEDPEVKLIIFDIFDTLVTRPLLDPENTKRWVARCLNSERYPERRHAAEASLRTEAKHDVSLAEICAEYVRLFGNAEGEAAYLQALEESVELALALPLPNMLEMIDLAKRAGKRVVLASDMFLSEDILRQILGKCGVEGYDALYLSSRVGKRKSTGALYHHIMESEGVLWDQIVMIGDHPLSDQLIPKQLGLHVIPLESPLAVASYFPRLKGWVEKIKFGGLPTDELVLGNIVRAFFQVQADEFVLDRASLTQRGRYGIGYAIVGPLLAAFSEWLSAQASADGIDRLYFLAREGQLMKDVYDVLTTGLDTPQSEYLVLSRRAISVAMIRSREDILAIASTDYQANSLAEYLLRRFGLDLNEAVLAKLHRQEIWLPERRVEIHAGQIDEALIAVLDALADDIYDRAVMERGPMLSYLRQAGLMEGKVALVDVGYAGTIQGRLCELLERKIQGYYMVTRAASASVRARHGVRLAACFGEELAIPDESPLLRYNVPLEMLMGSDDPQISYYRCQNDQNVVGVYAPLSEDEKASIPLRRELREGAMAFARDYRAMKDAKLGELRIDPKMAVELFRDFWEGASASERAQIVSIAADDHYCGMGIVHFATFLPR
jgi:predicted HAD superfamily hydrolase